MRLRQIALAARDLSSTLDALCDVLGLEGAFNDPGVAAFGLENGVLPIGETFSKSSLPCSRARRPRAGSSGAAATAATW